jgi:MATE family multidrug resistance protein
MGSASALLTFCFYLFNFLCTATTPLVSRKRASGDLGGARAVGGQALTLSLVLGTVLAVSLEALRHPLLSAMGTSVTGEAANSYGIQFLTVRALAAPAILSIEASTGVLRGFLDTRTAVLILVAANVLNLLLDTVLIAGMGWGPLGAAVATTTAEWTSAGLFFAVLSGRLPSAASPPSTDGDIDDEASGTRLNVVPLLSVPPWEEVRPLVVASGSVFCRALVLQCFLSAAAIMAARGHHVGAGSSPAASVAAHQIGIQLWLLCSFFCDSLAAASQGLVADAIGRDDPCDVADVSRTVFLYSFALGMFLSATLLVGANTGFVFDLFTRDLSTRTVLADILPLIVAAQPLNALVFAADGVLQGASEFPFQAKSMAASGLAAVASFVALEAMTEGQDVNTLVHVWWALLILQAVRGVTSLWKLADPRGPINLISLKRPP